MSFSAKSKTFWTKAKKFKTFFFISFSESDLASFLAKGTFINDVTQTCLKIDPLSVTLKWLFVVYFDQPLGALHSKRRLKSAFCVFLTLLLAVDSKMMKNEAKMSIYSKLSRLSTARESCSGPVTVPLKCYSLIVMDFDC